MIKNHNFKNFEFNTLICWKHTQFNNQNCHIMYTSDVCIDIQS